MKGGQWVMIGALAVVTLYFMTRTKWTPPSSAEPYLADIMAAEYRHNMPKYLLARLLYQESRYRDDIIFASIKSSAGAVGIAQIIPKWHPNATPTDPIASIHYAAQYLTSLNERFNSWETALAAYNWGPTAVNNAMKEHGSKWLKNAPTETQNYVSEIWGDVA